MSSGAKTPEQLRAEIEQTREQLGETVEALAERTDVRARLRAGAQRLSARAREAMPSSASQGLEQLDEAVRRRPLPFLLGGLMVGVLAGRALAR